MEINFVAYDTKLEVTRTLQKLLLSDKVVNDAKIITSHHAAAILMNFENWEKVAQFYQWCTHGEHTRQLLATLRVTCGPIHDKSAAHFDVQEILNKRATDQIITVIELNTGIALNEEEATADQEPHDKDYLAKGVFCQYCECNHVPYKPSQ